jgi:hypothetical protein
MWPFRQGRPSFNFPDIFFLFDIFLAMFFYIQRGLTRKTSNLLLFIYYLTLIVRSNTECYILWYNKPRWNRIRLWCSPSGARYSVNHFFDIGQQCPVTQEFIYLAAPYRTGRNIQPPISLRSSGQADIGEAAMWSTSVLLMPLLNRILTHDVPPLGGQGVSRFPL